MVDIFQKINYNLINNTINNTNSNNTNSNNTYDQVISRRKNCKKKQLF